MQFNEPMSGEELLHRFLLELKGSVSKILTLLEDMTVDKENDEEKRSK